MLQKELTLESVLPERTGDALLYETDVDRNSTLWKLTAEIVDIRRKLIAGMKTNDMNAADIQRMKEVNKARLNEAFALLTSSDIPTDYGTLVREFVYSPRLCNPGMGMTRSEGMREAIIIPVLENVQDAVEHGDGSPMHVTLSVTRKRLTVCMQNKCDSQAADSAGNMLAKVARHETDLRILHAEIDVAQLNQQEKDAKERFNRLIRIAKHLFCRLHPDLANGDRNEIPKMEYGFQNRGNGMTQLAVSRINRSNVMIKDGVFTKIITVDAQRLKEITTTPH